MKLKLLDNDFLSRRLKENVTQQKYEESDPADEPDHEDAEDKYKHSSEKDEDLPDEDDESDEDIPRPQPTRAYT